MSTKEYSSRLQKLSESNKASLGLINQLSRFEPNPASPDSWTDLSENIQSNIKDNENDYELLKQGTEDFIAQPGDLAHRRSSYKEEERIALITQLQRFEEDLKLLRTQFRRAALQAKRNAEASLRKAREQLFASANQEGDQPSGTRRKGRDSNKTQEELTLSAAGDVTAGLRRLHSHLNESLGRNAYAKEILAASTAALQELDDTYSNVVEHGLKTARGLVGKLITTQKSDTWYLESALYILVGTLIWLIFRRWFFGPFLYLIYKPSRLMFGIVYSALNLTLSVLTGTLFSGNSDVAQPEVSNTRAPLIIKPSAGQGDHVKRQGPERPSVKVGLGGGSEGGRSSGEKLKDEQGLLEEVAKMADQVKNAEKAGGEAERIRNEDSGSAGGQAVRGDGTVLRERTADEKPNPKKRMMEVPPEDTKPKDEL